jgi:hypothetical protein
MGFGCERIRGGCSRLQRAGGSGYLEGGVILRKSCGRGIKLTKWMGGWMGREEGTRRFG